MTKSHYYLLQINGVTIRHQTDLVYCKMSDEFSTWHEATCTFYDVEDGLNLPSTMDKVRILRNNVRDSFVDSLYIGEFIAEHVKVTEIRSCVDEVDELTIKLTSKRKMK